MEMNEVLCLKWNNHKSIFLQNLSSLRTQELYSDATITCNGKYFSVHRLVLSTCSEYFEEIFERISMQSIHPFIIVTNIESGYLEALLNFMYNGEVNVLHEMLPGLIKAAEILKIKGLAVPDEEAIEKELIYAREREVNLPSKEPPHPSHTNSSPRQSPTIHRTVPPQQMTENMPANCIIPDDMSLHPSIVATSIQQKEVPPPPPPPPPVEHSVSVYHTTKDEVVEMCPMESPGDYVTDGREHEIRMDNENEIKLEDDAMTIQNDGLPPQPPPPPHVPPTHIPPPPIHVPPSQQHQQHYPPPPPAHLQPLISQENEIPLQDPMQHYTPPLPPPHQCYSKEPMKTDYEMDHGNGKCSAWDGSSVVKESDSNAAAAAVVQEVIQGLLLQSETEPMGATHENGGVAHSPCHLRHTIKREDEQPPTPQPPKPKIKKRTSSTSTQLSPTSKKCPKCTYVTKYVSTLRRHIMFKHTGEKPHKCHFCPYRSAHNFNMKKHMMIHTGEKPFSCPLCSYKAAQNSNIKSHMKSHEKKLLKAAIKGTKKEKV